MLCSCRVRTDMSTVEPILVQFWLKGMTGVKSDQQKKLVEECSQATGLAYSKLKVRYYLLCKQLVWAKQVNKAQKRMTILYDGYLNNYWPISILSVLSKISEHVVNSRLMEYMKITLICFCLYQKITILKLVFLYLFDSIANAVGCKMFYYVSIRFVSCL